MPNKYTGSGVIQASDYKFIKFEGLTKDNKAVTITMPKAICRSNPEWNFVEKDDTVSQIEFEGAYDDAQIASGDRTEPWTIEFADGTVAGAGEIVLGAGKVSIGTSAADVNHIGLTRGGNSFIVERELREINADGDPGLVAGRLVQEMGRPKLTIHSLEWLTKIPNLYSGMKTV